MIPIGPILIAIAWAMRQANKEQERPSLRPPVAKKLEPLAVKSNPMAAIGPVILAGAIVAIIAGRDNGLALWKMAPLAFIALVAASPWAVATRLWAPLGWYRAAYWQGRSASFVMARDDGESAGLLAASLAVARRPSPEGVAFVEERLAKRTRIRGASLAAAGLIAHVRGDREAARSILDTVDDVTVVAMPGIARRVARRWRVADAAERGDWHAVERIASVRVDTDFFDYLDARFFEVLAQRHLCEPQQNAAMNGRLLFAWLVCSGRMRLRSMLSRALAYRRDVEPPAPKIPTDDPLAEAIVRRERTAADSRPAQPLDVIALAEAWDRAFRGPGLSETVEKRARELGTDPARVMHRLREVAVANVADAALETNVQLAGRGTIAEAALRLMRTRLLGDVEIAARAMRERVDDERAIAPIDEWREFATLRALHQKSMRSLDMEGRRLSFSAVSGPLCSLGVWLFNKRNEKVLANTIFRWLLEESKQTGDQRLTELYQKNVNCGIL